MSDDNQRQEDTTTADLSRQVATSDDSEYSLSIEEALARYEAAGLPRTTRSIQRYCAKRDLDAHRIETPFGERFLITPASVDRHIKYIQEVRLVATSRDLSRQAATGDDIPSSQEEAQTKAATTSDERERQATTTGDKSQLVAPQPAPASQPVVANDRVVDLLERENAFLRDQVTVKDKQIEALSERVRETNILTGGLHKLLAPLLGSPDRTEDEERG